MQIDDVSLLAGSPSTEVSIDGKSRTFSEPFQLIIHVGDLSYRIAPLMENYQKPGLPNDAYWNPSLDPQYSYLRMDKTDYSTVNGEPMTVDEVDEISKLLNRMGKGTFTPKGDGDRPVDTSLAVAVGLFLEPRIKIAAHQYIEGQPFVEKNRLEDTMHQQTRDIPDVSRS